ncbi:hypothetical protein IKG28_03445, partial [Candidatus Saccharibacteria bacterium]|nr:hypothetical protein [Candidatus Saccharibacteria bacterium]
MLTTWASAYSRDPAIIVVALGPMGIFSAAYIKAETKDYLLLLYTSTGRASCTRILCTTQTTTGTSGLVLCSVAPTLIACTSAARTSILPAAAIGTTVGPSAAWSWQLYPNTEDKGFVYSPLFFVRGGDINGRTLKYAGYNGTYWSSTVQSVTNAR